MSLAQDILRNMGVDVSPKARRKPNATYMELAKRCGRATTGFKGVFKDTRHGTFRARGKIRFKITALGSFSTPERAALAVRLYDLWHKRGFKEIPSGKFSGYIDYARHL